MERITFRHLVRIGAMEIRAALAGATAALLWAAQEPLDQRVFGCGYSDVALLGKAVSRRRWKTVGLAIHVSNGAAFGMAWAKLDRRRPVSPVALALVENAAFWPLTAAVDRYHPARGEPDLPRLHDSGRAFAQACWRHALFGWVLGRLA
jgi:hypothetical protein